MSIDEAAKFLMDEVNSKPCPVPGYQMSLLEARLVVAQVVGAPRDFYERERDKHRAEAHGGKDGGDDCGDCGCLDSAVYYAQHGRHLSKDFYGVDIGKGDPR